MTTYNVGGTYAAQGRHPILYAQFAYIDLTARAAVAADVWNVFYIPKNTVLYSMAFYAATSAGATCTVDIADTTKGTTYEANLSLNTTGALTINDTSPPVYYTAADIIKFTWDHSNTAFKGYFYIECIDMNPFLGV